MLSNADPHANFLAHAGEIRAAIERVLASGHYILGREVEGFESEFAAYLGTRFSVGVANGTDALELSLRALGIGPGDAVATVANTTTATVAAIAALGAKPVFIDIEPATMLMDADKLAAVLKADIARKIKAVVPVHLFGLMSDMPAILAAALAHGAVVVEDCAQAHGAALNGRKAGTWGQAAAFSFYPTKNLGALGDGGAVVTSDPALAEKVRTLRQYGWRERYVSDIPGRNSRLDEMQAAVLRVKLKHLDAENHQRQKLTSRYLVRLAGKPLLLPVVPKGVDPVWHQFVVRHWQRDALKDFLASRNINCGVLYPVPIHRQPGHAQPNASLPETERACAEVLCLPVHPALTEADVDMVCTHILAWTPP